MDTKTAQEIIDNNPHIREFVRRRAGEFGPGFQAPIEVKAGIAPPSLEGESHYYTNRSGDRIAHPSAYAKKGWSSLRYCFSTLRVEVGIEWLKAHRPSTFSARSEAV